MGTLSLITSNGQYKKYTYTHGGASTTGAHVFTTKSGQSVAPAISTTKKPLSQLNPLDISPSKVIAKTNGCMYEYHETKFYGFFIRAAGNPMYIKAVDIPLCPLRASCTTIPSTSRLSASRAMERQPFGGSLARTMPNWHCNIAIM